MHPKKFKKFNPQKLSEEINQARSVNGVRQLIRKYLSVGVRRSLTENSPEFFLLYYLAFRLPKHQRDWVKLWTTVQYLLELAPRDHGKSWIYSYGLPLWDIYASYIRSGLTSVDARILQISKTDDQASKYAGQVRTTIEKNKFLAEDYGDIRDPKNWLKGYFRCKRGEGWDTEEKDHTYEKTGALGGVTGGHFHRINCDDILDDENTKTIERMNIIENWFFGTIWNLREPYTRYAIVGTRKNRRDLYNTLLSSPVWKANVEKAIIKYPMIPDPDKPGMMRQGWLYITDKGRRVAKGYGEVDPGETIVDVELLTSDYQVLWPPTPKVDNNGNPVIDPITKKQEIFGWGIRELLLDRAAQGSVYFDREKQNLISAEEGAIFQKNWFVFFDTNQLVLNETDGYTYLTTELSTLR